MAKAGLSSMVR